jgi:hypothetical protein
MNAQSLESPNWDSFGTPPWESWEKEPFECSLRAELQGEPLTGREATAPSIIRKIEKVQGVEQVPRNGSLTLPKDAAVKPFSLKGKLNAILIVLSPILARRSNGLPGGHAHLRRNFPRLEQNPFEGVLAIKVPSASFGPEIIEQKAPKNVEGLFPVREATRVVVMEVQGVVLFFEHGLPKKNEGPGNGEAVGCLPFAPDTEESTLSFLGRGAFHETVSGRFLEPLVATFAGGLNSHGLEPGCRNPSFGLATKAKGLQGCEPKGSPGVTSGTPGSVGKCEGVNPHTPKATPALGDGVPVDTRNFRDRFEGSNLNGLWLSLYQWKALEA